MSKKREDITLEDLQKTLGGRIWEKTDKKRLYLDEGYNTKKMKTTVYVYEGSKAMFHVSVYISCSSQPWSWIESQKDELESSIKKRIRDVTMENVYVIINSDNDYIDTFNEVVEDVSDAELFQIELLAERYIEDELNDTYTPKKVKNPNYVFYEKSLSETYRLIHGLELILPTLTKSEEIKTELIIKGLKLIRR